MLAHLYKETHMFGKLFAKGSDKLSASVKKMDGRLDALQAVCAAGAYIAGAEGGVDEGEAAALLNVCKTNELLSAAFSADQIEQVATSMLLKANGGFSGKLGLKKELMDIAHDKEMGAVVLAAAVDVAAADGSVGAKEYKALEEVSGFIGVKLSDLGITKADLGVTG